VSPNLIDRIKKILSKTEEAGCTPQEAEAAFAMASKLMTEHNLSMEDVRLSGEEVKEEWANETAGTFGHWTLAHNYAFAIAKEFCFVEGMFTYRYPEGASNARKVFHLFGTKENVAAGRFMFTALLEAFDRLWLDHRSRTGDPASSKRLYVVGVASGFTIRMRDERKAVEAERDLLQAKPSGSTALAVISIAQRTREQHIQQHFGGKEPKARSGKYAETRGSHSTFEAGVRDGKQLSLHRSIEA
jgi:hypothetical protein